MNRPTSEFTTSYYLNDHIRFQEIETMKSCIRCFCVSDIHADGPHALNWIKAHCQRAHNEENAFTVMIIPGDIGNSPEKVQKILLQLAAVYDAVCYLPGNHEAWVVKDNDLGNSFDQLNLILSNARSIGVHVGPLRIVCKASESVDVNPAAVVIMPLYAWYHSNWDTEVDILTNPSYLEYRKLNDFSSLWSDFSFCKWPSSLVSKQDFIDLYGQSTSLAEHFARINEPFLYPICNDDRDIAEIIPSDMKPHSPIVKDNDTVISFSHFLPRIELLPEKRFLYEPLLAKVVGSNALERQVRRLQPHLHLFGHTHIPIDLTLDGIRYVQWPLGYAREATAQCSKIFSSGPLLVYDSRLGSGPGGLPPNMTSLDTHWSKYYRESSRDESQMEDLAPWVMTYLQSKIDKAKSLD
mmetsp:Transcript_2750/g.4246  ORF Transcript_2750/g.4246 Transcript_2750/m.4246 type:complete len:409 (-) Transcript_2750:1585-2811(-)|eukprot:CAMPEP_0170082560 /NCGR_PEP_ID=MMETSP0019_2-20121128/18110_1 /TAXON_ID=98059 /ORGANISM="Dinobryon sp., Strain UTEXLB2267" /LENGTH=408 /DNA_ID=CAMNT_0010297477 /DNA_START=56 /DNA_END=1282 /DNA_ORIENTATION=+